MRGTKNVEVRTLTVHALIERKRKELEYAHIFLTRRTSPEKRGVADEKDTQPP